MLRSKRLSRWILVVPFFVISMVLLFLGFYRNQWNVIREKKFKEFQTDSESLVMARMVESRQKGIFSENGLLGWGDANPLDLRENDYAHQYDAYLAGQDFQTYSLYKSSSGLQAMFFSLLDELSPFSPAANLRNFRVLVSLLFAATLSVFLLWFLREFGWLTSVSVLVTTLVSQWITLFGRNLFYFIWASFLPMVLVAFYLVWEEKRAKLSDTRLALLAFGSLLFKCLMNGYDFVVPALAMPFIPLLYYGFRDGWGRSTFVKRLAALALALLAAVFISILILAAQLQISEGSFAGGIASILGTFGRRTYGDPNLYPLYAVSLEANPWSVLWTYISQDTAINLLGLRFLDLIIIFAIFSVIYVILGRRGQDDPSNRNKTFALIGATWFSILSPLSWFLMFKGQAYVHTHTNYLAWHMPFTLFGFALCGFVLRFLITAFVTRRTSAR
jgi:preprotein translocase subunit SecG